jgi:hypothetical protein
MSGPASQRHRSRFVQVEPHLDEILADPVVRAVMRRDRVSAEDIRSLLKRMSKRTPSAPSRPSADYP